MEHFETGEKCPDKKCNGILETTLDGGCSCHIHPPCSYCVSKNDNLSCSVCGEDPYEYEPKEYQVVRYWDEIYDRTVTSNLTEKEAKELAYKLNKSRTIYTSYGYCKMQPEKKTFLGWLQTLKINNYENRLQNTFI